ncbi:MAG: ankyrin repeat domain-containing protein, partial [Myxococcota bacterium]
MGELRPTLSTALVAAGRGDIERLRTIIQADRSLLSQRTSYKATLLHSAGSADVVHFLVEAGLDVDIRGWMNASPLFDAVSPKEPRLDVIDALLAAGADPNLRRDQGYVPLHVVGSVAAARLLLKRGASLQTAAEHGLLVTRMIVDEKPKLLQYFLEQGLVLSVHRSARDGAEALHEAVDHNSADAVNVLLRHGASIDAADRFGRTSLMIAASHGHEALVGRLLEAGANPDHRDRQGRRAVDFAAEKRSAALVNQLLDVQKNEAPAIMTDVEDAEIVWAIPHHDKRWLWAWTRQGWLLRLKLVDDEAQIAASMVPSMMPLAAAVHDESNRLDLLMPDRIVRLNADALDHREQTRLPESEWVPPVLGSIDGQWLVWIEPRTSSICVYDGRQLRKISGRGRAHDIAIDKEGRWLAIASTQPNRCCITLCPLTKNEPLRAYEVHQTARDKRSTVDALASIAFSPDGRRLACFETIAPPG